MTISSSTRKAGPYTGNGITTVFPFTFKVFKPNEVRAVLTPPGGSDTDLVYGTSYAVTLNGDQENSPGGVVTLPAPPATGDLITLTSVVDYVQPVLLTNQGGFYPAVLNDALDRLTIEVQQVLEQVGRALKQSITASLVSATLPAPAAGSVIGWTPDATGFQNYPPTDNTLLGAALALSSGADSVGTIGAGAGAVARTVGAKLRDTVDFRDFGAVGDGATDDTVAVSLALATGKRVTGGDLMYAVSGDITLPTVTRIRDAGFKQLDPNNANRRTLYQTNGALCHLENVKVDRNGTGAYGSASGASGIYLSGTPRVVLADVEVTGNDYGNGIVCVDCDDVRMTNPYVHDMTHGTASSADPGDDKMQGIWLIRGNRAVIVAPRVQNLKAMWSGQAAFNRWTRGIAVSGAKNWTIVAPEIDYVDQGIDISGDENPEFFAVLGGTASNCYTWGYKCANSVQNGQFVGSLAYRCGIAGFVASAPSIVMADLTQRIDYIGCRSIGAGYGGVWQASANVCGFRAMSTGTYADYPRGVRYLGCTADADGAAMKYGFFSDVTLGGNGDVWVEAVDCASHGHTVDDYYGLSQGIAVRQRSSSFSVPNNAWTTVDWDNTTVNRMSATPGATTDIYIRRSGLYLVTCGVEFAGAAAGTRGVRLLLNGGQLAGGMARFNAVDANNKGVNISTPVLCNAGDIVTAQAFQESGGALNLVAGSALSAALISPGMGR